MPISHRLLATLVMLGGLAASSSARGRATESLQGDDCNLTLFTPNYAGEIGALQGGRWDHFPIAVWIDASTVHNQPEMDGLRTGLSSWSDGTSGILGVSFTGSQATAQVEVRLVDGLPGDGSGRPVLGLTTLLIDGGTITHALVEIVRTSPQMRPTTS